MSLFDCKRGLKCFHPWDQMLHLSKLVAFMDRDKVIYNSFLCNNSAKYFPRMKEVDRIGNNVCWHQKDT